MRNLYRYSFGAVVYDEARAEVYVNGAAVHLQLRQRQLLSCLLTTPRVALGRDELLDKVWGYNSDTKDHALTSAIDRLRRALGPDGANIRTVHGKGYRLEATPIREVVGTEYESTQALEAGAEMLLRPGMRLEELLSRSQSCDVWRALHVVTGLPRVYKIASDADGLRELRRESRLLSHVARTLGPRDDLIQILSTHFEAAPYFIEMDYGGPDLARWEREAGFLKSSSRDDRIALFLKIADGVSALHGAGTVHADLKPSNILIDSAGGRAPQVRLIDFGSSFVVVTRVREQLGAIQESLAAPDGALADPTRGTFVYMAPELWRGGRPNERSDIYSLGVLLLQLLVGDLSQRPDTGWQRLVEDPDLTDDVARAIDGEPAERFVSVNEFAHSIRSLAVRREVRARAVQAVAEAARMEQENARLRLHEARVQARRPLIAIAFSLLLAGMLSISTLLWQSHRRNLELADQRRSIETLNRFLDEDLIGSADPRIVGTAGLSVADAAVRAEALVDTKYAEAPAATRALLHAELQGTLLELTRFTESIDAGQRALSAYPERGAVPMRQAAEIEIGLARANSHLGRLDEARQHLAAVESLLGPSPARDASLEVQYRIETALVYGESFDLNRQLAELDAARGVAAASSGVSESDREEVELQYGAAQKMIGHLDVADRTLRALLGKERQRYGADHPITCYTAMALAQTLGFENKVPEALELAQSALSCLENHLGRNDNRAITALDTLAGVHYKAERWDQAATEYADVVRRRTARSDAKSIWILTARMNEAQCLRHGKKFAEEQAAIENLIRDARDAHPDSDALMQVLHFELADALLNQGKSADVTRLLSGLDPKTLNNNVQDDHWEARLAFDRGRALMLGGNHAGALAAFLEARRDLQGKDEDARLPVDLLNSNIIAAGGHPGA